METSVNNKCKAFTSLEQSKVLAKILPLESADMYWFRDNTESPKVYPKDMMKDSVCVTSPCWSLAALISVLPNKIISHETAFDDEDTKDINEIYYKRIESNEEGRYVCCYVGNGYKYRCIADNHVNACVTMIEKLHELNLL